jgi:hypothetical protein
MQSLLYWRLAWKPSALISPLVVRFMAKQETFVGKVDQLDFVIFVIKPPSIVPVCIINRKNKNEVTYNSCTTYNWALSLGILCNQLPAEQAHHITKEDRTLVQPWTWRQTVHVENVEQSVLLEFGETNGLHPQKQDFISEPLIVTTLDSIYLTSIDLGWIQNTISK